MYYFYNGIGEYYLYCIQVCFREIRSATSVLGCPRVHTNRGSDSEALNDACIIVISSNPTWSPDGSLDSRSRLFLIGMHASSSLPHLIIRFCFSSISLPNCPYMLPAPLLLFFPQDKKEIKQVGRKLWRTSRVKYVHSRTHVLMSEISGVVMG